MLPAASPLGQPLDRVDGKLKVTGRAQYANDFPLDQLLHAVAFTSTIAAGEVKSIDTATARKSPGVVQIITHENAPPLKNVTRQMKLTGQPGQILAPLQDAVVRFDGEFLGIVIADSLEAAVGAANQIKIEYKTTPPTIVATSEPSALIVPKKIGRKDKPDSNRGDASTALVASPIRIDQTYTTPIENHNPMELAGTTAMWAGEKLTLWESTQHVLGVKAFVAAFLDIPPGNVRVVSPYLGGGFGCKGSVWPHTVLAAIAARAVGRPVKLQLTRSQMFSQIGHRPQTTQNISLGATADGKLQAITHDVISETSSFDEWPEPAAKQTRMLYACPNVRTTHRMARINTGTPCQMRAPGEASGTAALEVAMDELAVKLRLDPIELRLRNYADQDEDENKPFSSKALRECYRQGAQRFGWSKRSPAVRSMREGNLLIGMGMATAVYPTNRSPAEARVRLTADRRIIVSTSAHDLGTGTYTILAQIAAAELGIAVDRIQVIIGDTTLPPSPAAGGSQTAVSSGTAVQSAARKLLSNLAEMQGAGHIAPIDWDLPGDLDGAFAKNGGKPIDGEAKVESDAEEEKFSKNAWGAQFAEVSVDPFLGEIRVRGLVGAFAAGKILNAKTAHSQIMGAMVMGVGMALHEKTVIDPTRGRLVNHNLADYLVPVNADIASIDCFFVDEPDAHVNALGAKGVGELGITGLAAAIANAVYHATGVRVRDYPIRVEHLLNS